MTLHAARARQAAAPVRVYRVVVVGIDCVSHVLIPFAFDSVDDIQSIWGHTKYSLNLIILV